MTSEREREKRKENNEEPSYRNENAIRLRSEAVVMGAVPGRSGASGKRMGRRSQRHKEELDKRGQQSERKE